VTSDWRLHLKAFAHAAIYAVVVLTLIVLTGLRTTAVQYGLLFLMLLGLGYAVWIRLGNGNDTALYLERGKYVLVAVAVISLTAGFIAAATG